MMKIMIVDDMPVFREYLRDFIDWNAYGFEICCEAKDGREALELYEKYLPDIVLTDIVMPYYDGLELSEMLLKENPGLSIILITGNSEFEYARKAVKLGVCDFIVKPFEKEELIISLLKLQDNINRHLEEQNEKGGLYEKQKEDLLRKLIYSNNPNDVYNTGIFPSEYFMVVTVRIELHENKVDSDNIVKWKQILFELLHNMIKIEGVFEIFYDFEGNIVTLLNFRDPKDMESYAAYEFKDLIELAKKHLGFDISVGVSDYCYGMPHVKNAYYQTIQALSIAYNERKTGFFDYKKRRLETNHEFYSWEMIDDIYYSLDAMDYNRIEKSIASELDRIREYESQELAPMIYMSLLSLLFSYIVKSGRNIDDIFGKDFHPYSILTGSIPYTKKRSFIYSCYKKTIDYKKENIDAAAYQIAEQAKSYIDRNYQNPDLTIADISKELRVNQTYLRSMFKSKYHMTMSSYITSVRMKKARELILEGVHKLSSISYSVGYNDVSYFSKCYKKFYGYLPSATRKA